MENIVRQGSIKLAQMAENLGIRNLDPEAGKIFVTSGSGVVGHRVAMRFLKDGYADIRVGSPRPEAREELKTMGAEDIVQFAWDQEETYAPALEGVKSVLCLVAYHKDWASHFPVFLEACKKAGVRHFIKLSFYHARMEDEFKKIPLVKAHGECDSMLIDQLTPTIESPMEGDTDVTIDYPTARMSYTILYASYFMSNPFTFQGAELYNDMKPCTLYGASGNHGVNYVSPNDIAEVAVRVLLNPRDHYNKEYQLTGPAAIKDQEIASLLSKRLNKPVMYVDLPLRTFADELTKHHEDPEWMVKDLAELEKIKKLGKEETLAFVSNEVEKICGHKPQSFEDYLQDTSMMTNVELGHGLVVMVE